MIDAESALAVILSGARFDDALRSVADFIDLKSPYTLGHARAVADLAASAGERLERPAADVCLLRPAGLVHGFGRLGVSNSRWDKPGPLGAGEWERARMHPYLTEWMLHQSGALTPLGSIAVQHRERLDGSGSCCSPGCSPLLTRRYVRERQRPLYDRFSGRARALHTYLTEDGLRLSGWVFRPRAVRGELPTLIWLHGGPEAQERPLWQPLFQALVAAGIAVFAPNVRGSGGYGRHFATRRRSRTPVHLDHQRTRHRRVPDGFRAGRSGPDRSGRPLLRRIPDARGTRRFPRAVRRRSGRVRDQRLRDLLRRDQTLDRRRRHHEVRRSRRRRRPAGGSSRRCTRRPHHRPAARRTRRHDTNVPLGEAERIIDALRAHGAAPRFLLFPDEGHDVHDSGTARSSSARSWGG